MDFKPLQILLFLSITVSSAEALYKPGSFLVIIISILLPAAVLIGFCGIVVFICKNRNRIPILRAKFGTGGHDRLPQSSAAPQKASAPPPMMPPPMMPPPEMPPPQEEKPKDDEEKVVPTNV